MKNNLYTAIGLMSGTSMDGIDASLIKSDGFNKYTNILDKYYKFDEKIYQKLVNLRNLICNKNDLFKYSKDLDELERELTIFHSKIVNEIADKYKDKIDLIGFHGQTILHDPKEKLSKQIGNGQLLSQLTKKKVIYDFRQEDILNGGQGAPLVPIFHNLISKVLNSKNKIKPYIWKTKYKRIILFVKDSQFFSIFSSPFFLNTDYIEIILYYFFISHTLLNIFTIIFHIRESSIRMNIFASDRTH